MISVVFRWIGSIGQPEGHTLLCSTSSDRNQSEPVRTKWFWAIPIRIQLVSIRIWSELLGICFQVVLSRFHSEWQVGDVEGASRHQRASQYQKCISADVFPVLVWSRKANKKQKYVSIGMFLVFKWRKACGQQKCVCVCCPHKGMKGEPARKASYTKNASTWTLVSLLSTWGEWKGSQQGKPAYTKNASTWIHFWCTQEGRGRIEGLVLWLGVVDDRGYASYKKCDYRLHFSCSGCRADADGHQKQYFILPPVSGGNFW